MAVIVGITGKAGSGKDTAVEQFMSAHEHPLAYRLAFGTGVKHAAAYIFQEPLGKFYDNKEDMSAQWGITYREMLQKLGTDFARDMIDKDFWVKWLSNKVVEVADSIKLVFVTDVRFDNEADWIKKCGGIVVEIQRPGSISILDEAEQKHPSEHGVDRALIDVTIINRGTIPRLGEKLEAVLKGWKVIPAKQIDK